MELKRVRVPSDPPLIIAPPRVVPSLSDKVHWFKTILDVCPKFIAPPPLPERFSLNRQCSKYEFPPRKKLYAKMKVHKGIH